MACPNNDRLLHAYLDGELDAAGSVEFEEHLQSCPVCAQNVHAQHTLRQALREARLYERAPESLRKRITAALPGRPARTLIRRRFVLEWLAAAAIVLAAVFGAGYLALNSRQQANLLAQQLVDSHIRSLQPGHLFDVKSTDQHTVKPWFDGKLDFAPPVRDLAQQGFPLLGGRLDYLNQRTVAAMVYQRRQHLINEFVWPSSVKPANLPATQTLRGYHIICGWNHGMTYCAVSDVGLDELHAFVGLLNQ